MFVNPPKTKVFYCLLPVSSHGQQQRNKTKSLKLFSVEGLYKHIERDKGFYLLPQIPASKIGICGSIIYQAMPPRV